MASVNKVILIGRLTRDVEIKSFQSGDRIANLCVATSEVWKDKNTGERKEKSEFHNVVVKNDNIVRTCENYVKKGSQVYIEGQLQTRKWQDQSGNDKYTTEIVIGRFNGVLTLLDGRDSSKPSNSGNSFDDDLDAPF
jgi:single-strand DNA-binding protein